MQNNQPTNCNNCGAKLNDNNKCDYCGTGHKQEHPSPKPEPIIVNEPAEPAFIAPAADESKPNGCIVAVIVMAGLIALILLIGRPSSDDQKGVNADPIAVDSVTVDTTTPVLPSTTTSNDSLDDDEKYAIDELKKLELDTPTFKKLYSKARKEKDEFSDNTFIFDQTSPRYVNINGIFVYIMKDKYDIKLRLKIQYTASDWLFIKGLVFNTDGENHTYSTWEFNRDNGNGDIWEWYDDEVTYDISTLIKIANAKKAKIHYNGENYYKNVVITAKQQAAIKKQLQIYKGLLLGYDKVKSKK